MTKWDWWDHTDVIEPVHWTIHRSNDWSWFLTIILYRDMYLEMQHGPILDSEKHAAFMKMVMFKFEDIDRERLARSD